MRDADMVRMFPAEKVRVETGTIQFGSEDWPGIFLRGDNAVAYATVIEMFLADVEKQQPLNDTVLINRTVVRSLAKLLRSCTVRPANTGG